MEKEYIHIINKSIKALKKVQLIKDKELQWEKLVDIVGDLDTLAFELEGELEEEQYNRKNKKRGN